MRNTEPEFVVGISFKNTLNSSSLMLKYPSVLESDDFLQRPSCTSTSRVSLKIKFSFYILSGVKVKADNGI